MVISRCFLFDYSQCGAGLLSAGLWGCQELALSSPAQLLTVQSLLPALGTAARAACSPSPPCGVPIAPLKARAVRSELPFQCAF